MGAVVPLVYYLTLDLVWVETEDPARLLHHLPFSFGVECFLEWRQRQQGQGCYSPGNFDLALHVLERAPFSYDATCDDALGLALSLPLDDCHGDGYATGRICVDDGNAFG